MVILSALSAIISVIAGLVTVVDTAKKWDEKRKRDKRKRKDDKTDDDKTDEE